jgi:2,4-dichlorophenol 6-monooxygenase
VHFSADLSPWFHDVEALTHVICNPDVGFPCVLVPMGPKLWGAHSTDWLVHLISFAGDHKQMDDAAAVETMLRCLGLPDLNPTVHVVSRWPLDAVVASRFRVGRTFILGDAAHRMPPAGGHGMNTAIQDTYNLCWKIAAVLKGEATDTLLDTYETERRPTAQHVVATAFEGWQSSRDLAIAIGFSPKNSPAENWANIRKIWSKDPEGDEARRRLARCLPGIFPNYNSLNVGFGFTYESGAVIPDGTPKQDNSSPLAIFHPSTRPGHSLPHAWVEDLLHRTALGDLIGGRFVLIAGEAGSEWRDAALSVAKEHGITLDAFTVGGTEGDWLDVSRAWERLREHGPAGAILVRPDRFIAWRSMDLTPDPHATLSEVFGRLLQA